MVADSIISNITFVLMKPQNSYTTVLITMDMNYNVKLIQPTIVAIKKNSNTVMNYQ